MSLPKKDNADIKHMLLRIKRDCLEDYPWTESDPEIDMRYVLAMGIIAGLATEAVLAVLQDRKPNYQIETTFLPAKPSEAKPSEAKPSEAKPSESTK